MMATAFQLVGFIVTIVGLALWSVPAALIVAGVVLFVTGGLDARRDQQRNHKS